MAGPFTGFKRDLLEAVDGGVFLVYDSLGQRGVVEVGDFALAAVEHPVEEVLEDLALGCVLRLYGNQEPGEAGDGIGVGSGSVGDGDAVVGGHLLDAGRGFGDT